MGLWIPHIHHIDLVRLGHRSGPSYKRPCLFNPKLLPCPVRLPRLPATTSTGRNHPMGSTLVLGSGAGSCPRAPRWWARPGYRMMQSVLASLLLASKRWSPFLPEMSLSARL